MSNKIEKLPKRKIIPLQDKEQFYDRVMDRLYAVVERYVFIDESIKFTIFINAFRREVGKPIEDEKHLKLKYQGISKQRELLERTHSDISCCSSGSATLTDHWKSLAIGEYDVNEMKITKDLFFKVMERENIDFENLYEKGTLESYFEVPEKDLTAYQKSERPILYHYFKPDDCYLSVPLILFGYVDGIVHIVYEKKGDSKFFPKTQEAYIADGESTKRPNQKNLSVRGNSSIADGNVKDVIVGFSIEYEGVFFAWHLSHDDEMLNYELAKAVEKVGDTESESYKRFWEEEAIYLLSLLRYKPYYETHHSYFKTRLKQHEELRQELYLGLLRKGVSTILVDSYAHNISAHSLSTIAMIFSKRAERSARQKTLDISNESKNFKPIKEYEGSFKKLINSTKDSLNPELACLFQFLHEKGGFWSGLTRDTNPGGATYDLFSILIEDFATNVLYLGTIAESEGVNKVSLNVTFLQPEELKYGLTQEDYSKNLIAEHKIENQFHVLTIDFEKEVEAFYIDEEDGSRVDNVFVATSGNLKIRVGYNENPELELFSRFIHLGDDYINAKAALKNCKTYMPGGIVGKHALYTIIENELRNIKHYSSEQLKKAKDQGLVLNISIQQASVTESANNELYRIGVWIGLPINPFNSEKRYGDSNRLIMRRFKSLYDEVIDHKNEYRPVMGGNSQDKICASFLFNGNFTDVQNGSRVWVGFYLNGDAETSFRDRMFYPWITPAIGNHRDKLKFIDFQIIPPQRVSNSDSNVESSIEDTEIGIKAYGPKMREGLKKYGQYSKSNADGDFVLKKYFYLWKPADIKNYNDINHSRIFLDNVSRYRFVLLDKGNDNKSFEKYCQLRKNGIVRILDTNASLNNVSEVYNCWLRKWIPDNEIAIDIGDSSLELLIFDKEKESLIKLYHTTDLPKEDKNESNIFQQVDSLDVFLDQYPIRASLDFAHAAGGIATDKLLYRSHGIMNRYFIKSIKLANKLNYWNIPDERFYEWFEMMFTRVAIFDNRLMYRSEALKVASGYASTDSSNLFFRDKLRLLFGNEDIIESNGKIIYSLDNPSTREFIRASNFVVFHLSFIDKILEKKYQMHREYTPENIGLFIREEILPIFSSPFDLKNNNSTLPENFIIVITTGRGRKKWWDLLYNSDERPPEEQHEHSSKFDYTRFRANVIFRSIESLVGALDHNATQNDHFELKFRITKTLFGS